MRKSLAILVLAAGILVVHAPASATQVPMPMQVDARTVAGLRVLAEQGDPPAQFTLGRLYADGQGVPQDSAQAVFWYRKAADQGLARAQYWLGLAHFQGNGVAQDCVQAVAWWRRAAAQGHAEAQCSLGAAYRLGEGVPMDHVQAVAWFRKAAQQGQVDAQFMMSLLYANGLGVPQDYVEAHKWANLAVVRATGKDQEKYAAARDVLTTMMTPDQRAEAQRRAAAWVATASSQAAPSTEEARWRRAAPTATAILVLKPEDRHPSPDPDSFERSADAVVAISTSQGNGTAFLITKDGLGLTNHHVVHNQVGLQATLRDGRRFAVRVLRSNPEADVALIQINCVSDCYTLDPARVNPSIGREVHVIGNALSLDYTLTRGIVSGLRLSGGVTLVQTDAALNPGSSGGPMIDAKTRAVLAVVSWKVTAEGAEGVGFGVAVGDALRVLGIQWQ